jgi:hypothetical protein
VLVEAACIGGWKNRTSKPRCKPSRTSSSKDSSSRLLETVRAALSSVLTDPGATNSEKIRAATALARILRHSGEKPSAVSPDKKYGLIVSEMSDHPDPDTGYIVITPEIEAGADRVLRETESKIHFPHGADQAQIDAWIDEHKRKRGDHPVAIPFVPEWFHGAEGSSPNAAR